MKVIRIVVFALAAWLPISALAQTNSQNNQALQAARDLSWIHGPKVVQIGAQATLAVPMGYAFLNPADTKKLMAIMHNPLSRNEYLLSPDNMGWFTLFQFENIGYVKDTTQLNADDVLSAIKEGTAAENKERSARGWPTMTVIGWKYPPRYNATDKRLEWAIDARDSNNEEVTNYNTRILGRGGVMSMQLVTVPDNIDIAVNQLNSVLSGFSYVPSQTYSAYKPGDKIAEYGLAGLITGGAVAVAAKTGLLKWLFKFIWIGVLALLAAIKGFFGRIKNLFSSKKV